MNRRYIQGLPFRGLVEVQTNMGTEQLTQVVDEALERFRGRDLVASAEVVDVLLDLRLLLLEVPIPARRSRSSSRRPPRPRGLTGGSPPRRARYDRRP